MDTHLMIDTETAGQCANAAPLAIAAKRFTEDKMGTDFFVTVDLSSALGLGLQYEESILSWWLRQDTYPSIRHKTTPLPEALSSLAQFYDDDRSIWARGTDFDIGLVLRPAFEAANIEVPWKYSHVRDLRTLAGNRPEHSNHHPLQDCEHQISQLQTAWGLRDGLYEQTMPA